MRPTVLTFLYWIAATAVVGQDDSGGRATPLASKPFDLSGWKLTLPVAGSGSNEPLEISGDELSRFQLERYFFVSSAADHPLVFRAYCDGVTTRNSQYPRCELREMADNGTSEATWSTDSETLHTVRVRLAINHLPDVKRHVVAAQVHDADDDLLMIRLENKKLFIERNDLPVVMLDRDYRLGTPVDIQITAGQGRVRVIYQGRESLNWNVSRDGCYFKAGCYTQSNLSKGDVAESYGEVLIYRLQRIQQTQSFQFLTDSRLQLGTQRLRSASIRSGDVDRDGDLDLVVANGRHWPQQNFLFLNQGGSRFNVARPIGDDLETSYACELGDLDHDGDLDLVVGNDHAPTSIWMGDGAGHFSKQTTLGIPTSVRGVTLADVNADDSLDIIVICRGKSNSLFINDRRGNFDEPVAFGGRRESTLGVAVADINRDTWPDLILVNRDQQPNAILFGIDGTQFSEPKPFGDPTQSSRAVVTADFNADGMVDWAIGNLGGSNLVYLGDGQGGILKEIRFGKPDGNTYGLAVADMNNDRLPDLVSCNVQQTGVVALNQNAAESFGSIEFGSTEAASYALCLGDFDSDGDTDIAVANSDGLNRIYLNRVTSQ